MKTSIVLSPLLLFAFILRGTIPQSSEPQRLDRFPMIAEPDAEDEIYNEGSSAPTISFSLVQGGLSSGTVDGGNNIDTEAALQDVFGEDGALGTFDDDLLPSDLSEAIDAGSNAALPPDRFDLDGDGDTAEPIPIDRAASARIADGGTGSPVIDMGAYEKDASQPIPVESTEQPTRTYLALPYPNPATENLRLRFGVAIDTSVRITVSDATGRLILIPFDDLAQGGKAYEVALSTEPLASGVYFVRLRTSHAQISRKVVLAR